MRDTSFLTCAVLIQPANMPLLLCALGLLLVSLSTQTVLEAESGENVTIWCQHNLSTPEYIFWFKHLSSSVPHLVGCKHFRLSSPSKLCYFFSESDEFVMSVDSGSTSLTITAVDVSDTGLYYCSFLHHARMIFSNATFLQAKVIHKTMPGNSNRTQDAAFSSVLFTLTLVFGAVIITLLSVLFSMTLKHRKRWRGNTETQQDQEHDLVSYITHKAQTSGTHSEEVDTHVVYYSTKLTVV
ncbi:uncharacterized protein LOC143510016 isoform X2 [Brachyhypopomus gauderio]|uniref:uncharacterized protein LOC143510016 isoform X2 n=1 Tax=Brachyhypopomus gauderio TaxID=698409 RepID=UPI00404148F1